MIMVTTFSLLILSHVKLIAQFATLLVSAVILDTFVVRTALVPAIMRIAGWVNWWPSKFGSAAAEREFGLYDETHILDDHDHDDASDEGNDRDGPELEDTLPQHRLSNSPLLGKDKLVRKSLTQEDIQRRHALNTIIG
jgi:hypothetical protein